MSSREKQNPDALSADEEALRKKLLNDSDQTNLDRSVARDGDFGGGFGEGHYTGTSWDPAVVEPSDKAARQTKRNGIADRKDASDPEADDRAANRRAPAVHDDDYGSAGAGRFGGAQAGPGLTTGAASPSTPR
jgi:hypothetical protein